ncbi:hypothetical protein SUDANB150_06783 [Streptomyces sp. enrichment culture]
MATLPVASASGRCSVRPSAGPSAKITRTVIEFGSLEAVASTCSTPLGAAAPSPEPPHPRAQPASRHSRPSLGSVFTHPARARSDGLQQRRSCDLDPGRAPNTRHRLGTFNRTRLGELTPYADNDRHKLLDAYAGEPDAADVEVLPSGTCESGGDAARRPCGCGAHARTVQLPCRVRQRGTDDRGPDRRPARRAPLAAWRTLSLVNDSDIPDLPLARWARHGTYPPGPGPEIHDQTQLAQLIVLGRTVAVFPHPARTWLWTEHTAVPLADAPPVVTHIAWPAHSRSSPLPGWSAGPHGSDPPSPVRPGRERSARRPALPGIVRNLKCCNAASGDQCPAPVLRDVCAQPIGIDVGGIDQLLHTDPA